MINTLIKFALLLLLFSACSKKSDPLTVNDTTVIPKMAGPEMIGPDKFIVTMWCPPPSDDANMAILKRDGYTLTGISVQDPNSAIQGLDIAQKYGLKAQILSGLLTPENLNNPSNLALLNDLIDKIKSHPALDSYFLADEPGISDMSAWSLLCNYLRQKDPNHPGYINLLPTYASLQQLGVTALTPPLSLDNPDWYAKDLEGSQANSSTIGYYNVYLKTYIEKISPKLISYDHYSFLNNGDGPNYFLNLALVRNAAVKTGIPFLNIVQACTILADWRLVNENEMRWLAYTTMAYGGRGLSWFLYWGPASYGGLYQDGKRMPLADFAAAINKEISILGPELIKLNSTAVYQTSPLPVGSMSIPDTSPVKIGSGQFILGLFTGTLTPKAFMIVNRDYNNSSTAELTLNYGNATLWQLSLMSGKWEEVQKVQAGTKITVTLNPGSGALYKVVQ